MDVNYVMVINWMKYHVINVIQMVNVNNVLMNIH